MSGTFGAVVTAGFALLVAAADGRPPCRDCASVCGENVACDTSCEVGVLTNDGPACAARTCGGAGAPCCDRSQGVCCEGDLLTRRYILDPARPLEYVPRWEERECWLYVHQLFEDTLCGGIVRTSPAPDKVREYYSLPWNSDENPCTLIWGIPDETPGP